MAVSEFDIIERYFQWACARPEVIVGIGDDAAELAAESQRLLLDVSQIQEGREFAADQEPASAAHRLLAAASARLLARGATPLAFTLALSLPDADEAWLASFSQGLAGFARRQQLDLIGGDTTRGPRSAVIHLHGALAADRTPIPSRGAAPGDLIYLCGELGDGALAVLQAAGELQLVRADRERADRAWRFPDIRPECAGLGGGLASSATAITSTLAQDLQMLLDASGCGATLQVQQLPLGPALRNNLDRAGGWNIAMHGPALGALCFTVPASAQAEFEQRAARIEAPCAWVGMVDRNPGLRWQTDDGSAM